VQRGKLAKAKVKIVGNQVTSPWGTVATSGCPPAGVDNKITVMVAFHPVVAAAAHRRFRAAVLLPA